MSDEETTRKVTPAELKENFALRDEIKELRVLIAAIVRGQGRRLIVPQRIIQCISSRDTVTQEENKEHDYIVLTYQEK